MKLLVCVSQVPDTTAKISFTNSNTELDAKGVQFIMNPYDEWYALVRALELKEQLKTGKVTIFHVGPASTEPTIRKGLAIGADDAVRVNAEPSSASFVAQQIASYAKKEGFDAIFFGKETIDYNGAEVPAMVAELLDLPYVANATEMKVEGQVATLSREIEGGKEVLEVDFPFILSCAKGIAEQRIPNMQGIMRSRTKPLAVVDTVASPSLSNVIAYDYPPQKTGVKMIDPEQVEELIQRLHDEAKVI